MQVTLNLDEALMNEALQLTQLMTEELFNLALKELVKSRRKKNLHWILQDNFSFAPTLTTKLYAK